jgi:hypothetical protein
MNELTPIPPRLPAEPVIWYARFHQYCSLGPNRSIEAAFDAIKASHRLKGKRPGHTWYDTARKHQWKERAEAYDADERNRIRSLEEVRRFDAREQRGDLVDALLTSAYKVLTTANIDKLSEEEARALLPQIRLLFRDLLAAQRIELGLPQSADPNGEIAPITAEELHQAAQELSRWNAHHPVHYSAATRSHLLLLRNALAALYPDEASARRIAASAGLSLTRIKFSPVAAYTWHAILQEADHTESLDDLIAVVQSEYGRNSELRTAISHLKGHSNGSKA